jgi:hypothetical protein
MTKEERRQRFLDLLAKVPEPEPCTHCGRVVLAGLPCCLNNAVDNGYSEEEYMTRLKHLSLDE